MSTAQRIYDNAFAADTGRTPRSTAYKQGALAALRHRAGEGPAPCDALPYELGTAAADAWLAGVQEGHAKWRDHMRDKVAGILI